MAYVMAHLVIVLTALLSFIIGAAFSLIIFRDDVINAAKWVFTNCMNKEHFNSRLIFLMHGAVTSLGLLLLVIGFLVAKDKTDYPMMVATLGGSGVGAAFGRYFTNKGSAQAQMLQNPTDQMQPQILAPMQSQIVPVQPLPNPPQTFPAVPETPIEDRS